MIANSLKIALRNLRHNKAYSLLNIAGLSVGMTAAILISCLGLFGLAAFTAQQRLKEIGIRKVLGATATGIVTLLSKDFLKLAIVAFLIPTPFAWYVFLLAALIATFMAVSMVSTQAIRAARANPAKNLRTE